MATSTVGSMLSNALTERSARAEIECSINGEYSIACRRDRDDVYVPFNFIRKYFEVRTCGYRFT